MKCQKCKETCMHRLAKDAEQDTRCFDSHFQRYLDADNSHCCLCAYSHLHGILRNLCPRCQERVKCKQFKKNWLSSRCSHCKRKEEEHLTEEDIAKRMTAMGFGVPVEPSNPSSAAASSSSTVAKVSGQQQQQQQQAAALATARGLGQNGPGSDEASNSSRSEVKFDPATGQAIGPPIPSQQGLQHAPMQPQTPQNGQKVEPSDALFVPGFQPGRDLLGERPQWEIQPHELMISSHKLGTGNFGAVWRGLFNGAVVAIKRPFAQQPKPQDLQTIRREVAMLNQIRHPNCVAFYGACLVPNMIAIVTEYVQRGNLHDLIARKRLPPALRIRMARDTASGMLYLHRRGIIHRDLKSLNLLVAEDYTIRVADFGLAVLKSTGPSQMVGTPSWMAPELFRNAPCDERSDVYAFGMVMWELLTCAKPHVGFETKGVQQFVLSGHRPLVPNPLPEGFTIEYWTLLQVCWEQAPEKRAPFHDILPQLEQMLHIASQDHHANGTAGQSSSASSSGRHNTSQVQVLPNLTKSLAHPAGLPPLGTNLPFNAPPPSTGQQATPASNTPQPASENDVQAQQQPQQQQYQQPPPQQQQYQQPPPQQQPYQQQPQQQQYQQQPQQYQAPMQQQQYAGQPILQRRPSQNGLIYGGAVVGPPQQMIMAGARR